MLHERREVVLYPKCLSQWLHIVGAHKYFLDKPPYSLSRKETAPGWGWGAYSEKLAGGGKREIYVLEEGV